MEQKILTARKDYVEVDGWLQENAVKNLFLVSDHSLQFLRIRDYFNQLTERIGVSVHIFDDFAPNPVYESVEKGVAQYQAAGSDAIMAVGGGSAIDVAKCIKLYSDKNGAENFLGQEITANTIPFLAMPTTAGTGSEATRYAVIYYNGMKQSIADSSCIPGTVLMDSSVLKTLPLYQKKSTMMDALCHALESFWSVNSTGESKTYSKQAMQMILANWKGYIANDVQANAAMLMAANIAGKAINITQTTAGHAMCYKMTSLYGIAHGHAAALCDRELFPWMLKNMDRCIDPRGEKYLGDTFQEIAKAMGCKDSKAASEKWREITDALELFAPTAEKEDYKTLTTSVNPVRLRNHPIRLDGETIDPLYHEIFAG